MLKLKITMQMLYHVPFLHKQTYMLCTRCYNFLIAITIANLNSMKKHFLTKYFDIPLVWRRPKFHTIDVVFAHVM